MKLHTSMMVLGFGITMSVGHLAYAQMGGLGDAVKKGAVDAVTPSTVPAPATEPATEPAADAAAAETEPAVAAEGDAGEATAPAEAPETATAPAADGGGVNKMMMDKVGEKVMDEGAKKMMPKMP